MGVETETEGVVAGADVRQMFESAGQSAPGPLWLGYGADNHRGFREAPLLFDAQFRHLWVTGTTGYGKSTELLNLMIQWAYVGYGFVFADPKAADSRQLLRMLPEHRLDDVVWIEPRATDHDKAVGLNFLELPECASEAERANETDIDLESDSVVARLTETGANEAAPDSGGVRAAGGSEHDALLEDAERALARHGFSVQIIEQDGSTQPDGRAVHPAFESAFTVEAESTTPERPAKVLENLARAKHSNRTPIFVVRPGEDVCEKVTRIESICSPPLSTRADSPDRFYNRDEVLTFGGGASTRGGVTAVRPRTGESNRTVWTRENGERVLSDGETEFARCDGERDLSKDDVPAYYSFDREASQYTVYARGESYHYDSREAFDEEWVPIKRPFLPSVAFPDGPPSRDEYLVVVVSDEERPMVAQAGQTYPLSECLASGELWPAGTETHGHQTERHLVDGEATIDEPRDSDDPPSSRDEEKTQLEGDGIEGFAAMYIEEDADCHIQQDRLFDAYRKWQTIHGLAGTTDRSWFTRKLDSVVDFEMTRSRVDGDRKRFYSGITLTPRGQSLLEEVDS